MKRSLHALETLQASLSSTSENAAGGAAAERQAREAARAQQLSKLSPYRRAEFFCLECVAELRDALRTVEEIQYTLHGTAPSVVPAAREEREAAEEDAEESDGGDERSELLGGTSRHRGGGGEQRRGARLQRRTGGAAVLEQELLRARQRARRAHQRLQPLQREAARLAKTDHTAAAVAAAAAASEEGRGAAVEASASSPSAAALGALEWQRAEKHVEVAKRWYREVFGIHVVSSLGNPAASSSMQLNRPAQPQQSAGSMSHFGHGANPLPPGVASSVDRDDGVDAPGSAGSTGGSGPSLSSLQTLRSAREDSEFRDFFASVQANDDLMDAALDRLSEGLSRLLDNARGMQDELAIQAELLQGTETRINENEAALANMNRRLRRAIREMEDSSICVYVVCLMVLLLILGVLLRVAG